MDVRQFDFLAAQPSAELKPRDTFCGISKRALALLLVNALFWQPIWAQAEGIVVSNGNGARLDQAGNGVPIVNIATPGANGLSHNQFQDYNVDSRGVILNNVTDRTGNTQLGGIIVGNPNLQGRAAGVILNEVVGGSPSQLRGYTEVAGQAARVIVANPYGVTCNGCGFINTPRVTLTTGKPILDGNRLDRFQVDGGSVTIEGNGLNADNVDQFDIVTRSAKINAELHARQLNIVAGRNDVAADSLAATPRAASPGDAPQLAIDSSALGGMYANTIRLVGTEAGVGVKLAGNLAASAGDIQLDANGQLTLAQAAASGNIALKSQGLDAQGPVYAGGGVNMQSGGDLTVRQSVAARNAITLNATGQLTNAGVIEAGINPDNSRNATGDVSLQGAQLTNRGSVIASRSLSATTAGTLDNTGATLSAGSQAQLQASTLGNAQGRIQSQGSLAVQATTLDNTQGLVTSAGALTATLGQTSNGKGEISSQARLTLQGQGLDNRQGKLIGTTGLDLTLSGNLDNRGGNLVSHGDFQARVTGTLDNRQQGNLYGAGTTVLSFGQLLNAQGVLTSAAALSLSGNQVNNDSGQLGSQGNLTATLGSLDQLNGQFISQGQLSLIADRLGNTGNSLVGGQNGVELRVTAIDNRGGEVSSQSGSVSLTGQSLLNSGGKVIAGSDLTASITTLDNSGSGLLSAKQYLRLNGQSLNNSAGGVLNAGGDLQAILSGALDNAGGQLLAQGGLTLGSASLNNLGGLLSAQGALAVTTGDLGNTQGRLVGQAALNLTAASLDNRQGLVSSVGQQTLTVTGGAVQNDGGQLVTNSGLSLSSASLDNGSGTLSAKGAVSLTTTGAITNAQNGRLIGSDTFNVATGSLTNAGRLASAKDLQVTTTSLINSGELFSQAGLTLDLKNGTLTNAGGGLITAPGALVLKNLGDVRNAGELSSGQAFTLAATSLDNSGGKLISNASLTLRIARALTNAKGNLSAAGLDIAAASLDNSTGVLTSHQDLHVKLAGDLLNGQGQLLSDGTLGITAANLDNRQGVISSAGQQTLTFTDGAVQNDGGQLVTDGGLTLTSGSLDNGAGTLSAKGAVSLTTTGALSNAQTGRLIGSDTFRLNAGSLTNAGRLASAKDLSVTTASLTNSGELFSQAGLTLDLKNGSLTNASGGLITAPGALLLKNLNTVRNAGELSSGQAFTLAATSLDNSGGKLISNASLTLRIARALTNAKGALSAAGLDIEAASLDNSAGVLTSHQNLRVALTGARVDGQGQLLNGQGQLLSDGTLDLTAADLDNRHGLVSSAGQQILTVTGGAVQNGGGQLVADGGLSLNSASLDNVAGTLSAKGAMSLTTGILANSQKGRLVGGDRLTISALRLDNTAGLISAAKGLQLTLSDGLSNGQGQLLSEGTLGITAANLDNRQGVISSAGQQTLTVTSGAVQNDGGQLVTDGGLTLSSASLDNGSGTLSAKGAVSLTTTGALSNAENGRLIGSDTVTVTAGSLTNAGRLASAKDLQVTTANLTNSGALFSQAGLTLDLQNGTLTNASGGLITAPGALLLNNLGTVRNAGELSSGQAFTLAATSLDNSGGKLVSNASLTLRIARALANAKGTLSAAGLDLQAASLANAGGTLVSRGALSVTTTGLLDNSADGLFSAATTLDVTANSLTNSGGSLLAKGAATVTTGQLDNTAKGLINSQAKLTLTADHLDSSNGGEVSAKGDLQLTLGELKQQGGRLIGEGALTLDLGRSGGTGNLDNTGGLITTTGVLSFAHLNQVTNTSGEISSAQSFELIAQALDNSKGKLISQGLLKVQAKQLTNEGGLLSGWQGLTVSGGNLSNRQSGTLSSKTGDLAVSLSGTLDNGGNGALATQGALTVTAANLNNTGGVLSSGGAQTLTVTGTLQNGSQGLIDAKGTLIVNAGQYANGGTTQAQQALSVSADNLDNSGGTLSGQAAVTLDLLGALTNTNGAVLAQGDLLLKRATQVANRKGRLNSGGLLTLLVGGLDNSNGGTLAGQSGLRLTASGQVSNGGDGLLASQGGALSVTASALDNNGGTLQSATGLTVATGSGTVGNAGGKLLAQNGDLSITAGNLDNRGGVLASLQGAFTAGISGLLANGGQGQTGGTVQAQRLDLSAGTLSNYNGKLSALGGDALIQAGSVDNRNGSLYGKGLVRVRGGSFDNSGDNDGQVFGNQIDFSLSGALNNRLGIIESNSTLSLAAASLDNTNGKLRALGSGGTTLLSLGGTLDNTNGRLESANQNLQLNLGGLINANGTLLHVGTGTFGLGLPLLQNAGGSITSNGTLTLSGSSWTNSSTLQVANLVVNVDNLTQTGSGQLLASNSFSGNGGNWTNDGLISAGGNFSLALGGTYQGAGRLSSGYDFTLNAGQLLLDNPNARLTAGSGTTTFNLGGLLRNQARITSAGNFTLNAGQVDNRGTLGAAGNFTINTSSLTNQNSSLIFSGGNMGFGVGNFTNSHADVYSLGDLTIGGYNSARASSLRNISGTLESGGSTRLYADSLENRTEGFALGRKLISGAIAVQCEEDGCSDQHIHVNYWVKEKYQSVDNDTSAASSITAGRDFVFQGGTFLNSKSTLSASGNISITANSVTNQGSQSGTIERTRVYYSDRIKRSSLAGFVSEVVVPYNQRNNPDFPNAYYIDANGSWLLGTPKAKEVRVGRDDSRTVIWLYDAQGNQRITNTELGYGNRSIPQSSYDQNNLVAIPDRLQQLALTRDSETVTSGGGAIKSAVIQAGGTVSINASQNLENSVIRQDYGVPTGTNRVQGTQVSPTGAPTVINLNSQLPPNLAQQQVNPTTLPGFTLPTGQNGLFRLSGQQNSAADIKTGNQAQWLAKSQAAVGDQVDTQIATYTAGRIGDIAKALVGTQTEAVASLQIRTPADTPLANQMALGTLAQASKVVDSTTNQPATGSSKLRGSPLAVGSLKKVVAAQGIMAPEVSVVLPTTVGHDLPHRYLVETNPALTDLKQFLSSDYLLGNLHYDPDTSWKRLGDGLYEQRLVQQAIVQRTGQRFIDGLTSDEAQFKYLMDNAIASKQALGLSVGVSLTAAQVAALTHDIVWMEDQVINGEHVLVPVLYLANANNRLAPNGALIQGSDVTLIAGNDLSNSGTLKATGSLSATAGNDLVNSGLIQSGDRLSLTSTSGDISNRAGGIISGRDVSLTATRGDILNERTITTQANRYGDLSTRQDYADSAARIEAGNNLSLVAGRDINNVGSVLSAGGNATLIAGRDVNLVSAQTQAGTSRGANNTRSSITQLTGSLTAGRDLGIGAGRDLTATATTLTAGGNATLSAQDNLTLSAAADETHSYSYSKHGGKKVTTQTDHVDQQATTLTAGGNVSLVARQGDLTLVASKVEAANEAYLYAGKDLNVLAAQDSDYSLYSKKSKGSFGSKSTKRDEVTDVRNIGSEIKAGGDITLQSEGNQTYQAAKLSSGKDLTLNSGGDITFEAVKDLHQESHEKSGSSAVWQSAKGKGNTDETLKQSQLVAQGQLAIQAANKIHIDVKDINAQSVSQTVDAMVKADPNLAWIKQAEQRGDIDWRQVKEVHDSFKYSHSGLSGPAAMVIAIVVAYFTAGAASTLVGNMAGAVAGSGTSMAAAGTATASAVASGATVGSTVAAGWANAAASAALTSMASSGAVSLINNRGNIGATLKDTLSSNGLKNAMIAAGTAGVMNYASSNWFKTSVDPVSGKVTGAIPDLSNPGNFTRFAETQLLQGAVKGTLSQALGQGKLSDSLKGSVFSILQAAAFNEVGDLGKQWHLEDSGLGKTAMHAVVGGLLSEAMGGDFKSGAVAAGANEALIETLDKSPLLGSADQSQHQRLLNMASQLVGLVAAASVGGNAQLGAEIAGNAQAYNRQLHSFERKLLDDKAQELQQNVGNTKSGVSWETLLTLVGGAAVDSEDSQKLAALEASLKDNNPENVSLKQDLAQAQQVIDQLRSQRIALHWSNGDAIVADGDKVYAFSATDAQRQDHALFDVASNTGLYNAPGNDPVVPDKYVQQFGEYVAAKHQSEIASVSSDTTAKDENWAALQSRTNSGLNDVTGAEILGVLPPGRAVRAGAVLSTTLQATAREAEESIAGGLAKAVSQDASRTGVPQWTVAAEDGYGARLAGSYKAGDTAYNGAAASDSAYGFNFGLTARESGAATRSDISDAMRADPYHPDWKSYVGGEARAVGADVTRIDGGVSELPGAKGGAKAPKTVEEISNPPQAPIIPSDWVSRPGRNGGEIYFPAGTDPAKGEHIRVMPPGSSPVPGYEYGYWRWQNSGRQPMNPATGKPGVGQGDTHVPLPPDSVPPVRR